MTSEKLSDVDAAHVAPVAVAAICSCRKTGEHSSPLQDRRRGGATQPVSGRSFLLSCLLLIALALPSVNAVAVTQRAGQVAAPVASTQVDWISYQSSVFAVGRCFSAAKVRGVLQNPHASSEKPSPTPIDQLLPPGVREKAARYSRIQYAVYFGAVALQIVIYLILWLSSFGVWLRRVASRASRRLFVQCLIFVPIFWVVASVIGLPLDYFSGYLVEHRFDLSTEGFGSWLGDWAKILGFSTAAAIIAAWILYRLMRRSPRRWWFWFWLITVPLMLFVMFGEPYVVEPMFFKFSPLERTQPALAARIERMLLRAGIKIPESRIYEMNASAKTRAVNAYVSGIGRSQRVVVWDTTIRDLTPDETLAVLGHETGHYVLHHGLKEFALDELIALVWFFLGSLAVVWIIRRWGARTGIESLGDLAGFPVFMLALTAVVFLASPMYCGVSRHYEHEADQYGLELTYGVVPDPNTAAAQSLVIMGERDLSDPQPGRFVEFWLFTHPSLAERIRFAESYHPWTEGKPMRLLKSRGERQVTSEE